MMFVMQMVLWIAFFFNLPGTWDSRSDMYFWFGIIAALLASFAIDRMDKKNNA